RLGRGGAAVNSDKAADRASGLKDRWRELLAAVRIFENRKFVWILDQAFAARLRLLLLASVVDVVNQIVVTAITSDTVFFRTPELDGAQSGEVLRVLRYLDQVFWLRAFRNGDLALLPHARNIGLPGFTHAANETVGST